METHTDIFTRELENCYVVLGAGPSGLAAAWKLAMEQEATPVVLVEKSSKVGGLSSSFSWQGCTVDYGPHRLSPAIPEIVEFVNQILGPELLEIKSQHMVLLNNALFQFPPRVRDFLNLKLIVLAVRSAISFFSMKVWRIKKRFRASDFSDVLTYKFGTYFSSRVVEPMSRKVWPGKTENLDPRFVEVRFKVISLIELIRSLFKLRENLNPKIAYYPKNGYGQIFETMVEILKKRSNFYLLLDSQIEALEFDNSNSHIQKLLLDTNSNQLKLKREIFAKDMKIISSIPLTTLVGLIERSREGNQIQLNPPPTT